MVIKTAVDFYSEQEIKKAKDLIFDLCANTTNPPMRNTGRTGSGKSEKHLMDIYALMSRVPTDKLPVFTAANLAKLPSFDMDCFDLSTLSQQVKEIRKGVKAESEMHNLLVEFPVLKAQLNELLGLKSDFDKMKKEILDLSEARTTVFEMASTLKQGHALSMDYAGAIGGDSPSKYRPQASTLKTDVRNLHAPKSNPSTDLRHSSYANALLSARNLSQNSDVSRCPSVPMKDGSLPSKTVKEKAMDIQSANIACEQPAQTEGYTLVQRKKRRPPLIGKRNDSALSVIKGKRSKVFISRLSPESTSKDIEDFINKTFKVSHITCEKLKTKHNSYASFKIDMVVTDSTNVFLPENWPDGVLVRKYFTPKNDTNGSD